MREFRKSGSVGAPEEQSSGATRQQAPVTARAERSGRRQRAAVHTSAQSVRQEAWVRRK
jgi:hypothetical protein